MHMHAQLRIKDDELRVLTSQVGLKFSMAVVARHANQL